MQQSPRKIIKSTVKIADTPEKLRYLLEISSIILGGSTISGGIHGGSVKALLGWILMQEKIIESSTALNIFLNGETDLDIIVFQDDGESIDSLERKFNACRAGYREAKIDLRPDDVSMAKVKTIEGLLKDNDLTINEVFAAPSEHGTFSVYYTDICLRDTIAETGILTGNKAMTTRMQLGQIYPTNFGVFRLVNALAKKRVKHIYIPARWIEANNNEARKMRTENFGIYGLLLTEKFKDDIKAQKELMKILFDLGVTAIKDFSIYKREQEQLFRQRSNGTEFVFDSKRSFRQTQESLREKEAEGKKGKEVRDQIRKNCNHQVEEIFCNECENRCKIQKCTKCTTIRITPHWSAKYVNTKSLRCNQNWEYSNFYWDEKGFYPDRIDA